jgi:hypothetical protein
MTHYDDFISKLNGNQRQIVESLHSVILSFPGTSCKIRWGIPFFDYKKWVCYINPRKDGKVDLTFLQARKFDDPTGLLEARGRKMVKSLVVADDSDDTLATVIILMEEALKVQK